jgi:hypothetical protein
MVYGAPISSTKELQQIHRMPCRDYEEHTAMIRESGSHDVALDIVIRCSKQILHIGHADQSVLEEVRRQQRRLIQ